MDGRNTERQADDSTERARCNCASEDYIDIRRAQLLADTEEVLHARLPTLKWISW